MNKNKLTALLLSILCMFGLSSCLTSNTESIEAYSENDINEVVGIWYRYITKTNDNTEQVVMKKVELDGFKADIDKENSHIFITVSPSKNKLVSIPDNALKQLTINNIGVVVALPTAARIFPINGAPKLGINGDWSKPNHYIVQAANGDKKEWVIEITEFNINL